MCLVVFFLNFIYLGHALWIWGFPSGSVVSNSLRAYGQQPTKLLCPWNSPGKNTGVGSHSFLQGIFPIQGLNPGLLHCGQTLYSLKHQRSLFFKGIGKLGSIVIIIDYSLQLVLIISLLSFSLHDCSRFLYYLTLSWQLGVERRKTFLPQ